MHMSTRNMNWHISPKSPQRQMLSFLEGLAVLMCEKWYLVSISWLQGETEHLFISYWPLAVSLDEGSIVKESWFPGLKSSALLHYLILFILWTTALKTLYPSCDYSILLTSLYIVVCFLILKLILLLEMSCVAYLELLFIYTCFSFIVRFGIKHYKRN